MTLPAEPPSVLDGVEVADLGRGARGRYGIPQRITGVLVTRVDADPKARGGTARWGCDRGNQPQPSAVLMRRRNWSARPKGNGSPASFHARRGSSRYLTVETGKNNLQSKVYHPVETKGESTGFL